MKKIAAISINKTSLNGFLKYKKHFSNNGYELKIIHEEKLDSSINNYLSLNNLPLKPKEFEKNLKIYFKKRLKKFYFLVKPFLILVKLSYWIFYLYLLRKKLRSFFIEEKINYLLLYGDRALGLESEALLISKKIGIKSIIVPIVIPASKKNLLKNRGFSKIPFLSNNFLFARYLMYGPVGTLATLFLHYPIHDIWNCGSSMVDRLCVFNENLKNYYIKNGIDEKKIKISGSLDIAEVLSEKNDYLKTDKFFILINLPTLYEHNFYNYQYSHKVQRHIIKNISKVAAEYKLDLVVNLHPKQKRKAYSWLKQYDVTISKNKLAKDLINSICYVTGQGSSTIAYADELKKHSIVCGWYGLEPNYNYQNKKLIYECLDSDLFQSKCFEIIGKAIKNPTVTNLNYNIDKHINNLLSGL